MLRDFHASACRCRCLDGRPIGRLVNFPLCVIGAVAGRRRGTREAPPSMPFLVVIKCGAVLSSQSRRPFHLGLPSLHSLRFSGHDSLGIPRRDGRRAIIFFAFYGLTPSRPRARRKRPTGHSVGIVGSLLICTLIYVAWRRRGGRCRSRSTPTARTAGADPAQAGCRLAAV